MFLMYFHYFYYRNIFHLRFLSTQISEIFVYEDTQNTQNISPSCYRQEINYFNSSLPFVIVAVTRRLSWFHCKN